MSPIKTKFWQFRAAKDEPKVGELMLYGSISDFSWWGDEVTPKQFKEDLDALGDIDVLKVFINSGGGDAFAGQAIHSMLKRHKAQVNVYVDGLAASIASVIAMAGDKVIMPRNAMMMIHNPWTWGFGDARAFREIADRLDKIRESLVVVYEGKSGMERERIIELLDAETWMTADEAVEMGFADEIEESKPVAASIADGRLVVNGQQFDLSRYRNPPKLAFLPPADAPDPSPSPRAADPPVEPNNPTPTAERQAPLSLYAFRQRVNANKRRVTR